MACLFLAYEMLIQKLVARKLPNPMPLPPIKHLTFIVTGSTSGIGKEIARELAEAGAHVVMAVRNPKAATGLINIWQNNWSGRGIPLNIETMELDLLSLQSVSKFAESWNQRSVPLHCLINNAGILKIGLPQEFSKDGYEQHMQVNHLAPSLLSVLLLPSLIKSSSSRIVNVNSIIHYFGKVDPQDMNITSGRTKFSSMVAYSSSKLASIMFSSVLNKRMSTESGIHVVCVHPGMVKTNVARDLPKMAAQCGFQLIPCLLFNPQEGSRSTLFAATDVGIADYYESMKGKEAVYVNQDCRAANPSKKTQDVEACSEVWEKTLELIGLPSDAVEILLRGGHVQSKYGASMSK